MNKVFKLFTVLLMVGLAFGITACKPDDPIIIPEVTEFSVLGGWTDGGDGVYTLNTNTTSELDFTYDKAAFPDAFMSSANIAFVDLSIFKKLVITVEGTGTILVKLETNDTTPAKEVGLNVTGIQGTYEWNLIADSAFLAKVDKIVIIAAPGKEDSIGAVTVSELRFDVAVADGFIIQTDFSNIPTNVNEYNGTDETFDFNMKWENFAEETYTISYVGSTTVVSFDKAAGQEWSTMQSSVQGDFTDFNYVVAIVSGTVGQKFLLKAANGYENFVFLTAEEQEVVVDISAMTVAEKNAITSIFAFGKAGAIGTGNFVIHEAFMTADYEYVAPVIIKNIYNGTDLSFTVNQWYDGGDNNYALSVSGTDLIVNYDKTSDWANMVAFIEGDMTPFSKLQIEVTGTLNKSALFKVEGPSGNIEKPITFDGTKQTIVIDLTGMSATQLAAIDKVLIFAAPGGSGAGQFTIHSTTFMTSDFSLQDTWIENDAGTYVFSTTVDDTVLVTYTKVSQGWAFMKSIFTAEEVAGLNTLNITLKGTDGKQVLVKANGVEQWVTFVGTDETTVTFTASEFTEIIMFAEGGVDNATGTFEIISAVLSYVKPVVDFDPTTQFDLNPTWAENDLGTYSFSTTADDTILVAYTKVSQGWVFMKSVFTANEVAGFNTLNITIKGTDGKQVLVKVNGVEKWVTFVGTDSVTVTYTAAEFTEIIMFAEGGVDNATGTFEVVSAVLSYEVNLQDTWIENDAGTYVFSTTDEDTVLVTYTKVAQGWVFMKSVFTAEEVAGMNTINITLKGTDTKQVLVKVNGVETWVTFVGTEPVTVTYTVSEFTEIIMFAEGGVDNATGTFEIIGAVLSYVEPAVDFDPTTQFDLNPTWVENDPGTYTFSTTVDDTVLVSYTKVSQGWVFMKSIFTAEEVKGFNTLNVTIKGTDGKQVLVKVNGIETWVTFVGTDPITVTYTASAFTEIIMFAEGGVDNATGTFEVVSAVLSYEVNLQNTWIENDLGTYTFSTTAEDTVLVSYTKVSQGWVFMKSVFTSEEVAGMNTLTVILKGTDTKQVLVKVNGVETWVTFVGTEPVTVTYTVSEFTEIIMFAEGGVDNATGTFEIVSAVLSYVEPAVDLTREFDLESTWVENDLGTYTFSTTVDDTVLVTYTKVAQGWVFMKSIFTAEDVIGLNNLSITLKGTDGKQVLVKANGVEQWVTFVGTNPVTVTFAASEFTEIIMFAEGGVDDATGTFEIVSAVLSYQFDLQSTWIENDAGTYAFSTTVNDTVLVTYTKVAQGWVFMKSVFTAEEVAGMNTLTITLKGTDTKQVLVKANGVEQWVTFSGTDETTVTFTAVGFTEIIMFAEGGVDDATGTFEVISAVLTYVQP